MSLRHPSAASQNGVAVHGGTGRRRVVVTGVGVISAFEPGVESFWDGLLDGRRAASTAQIEGVGAVTAFQARLPEGAEERLGRREVRRMDRCGLLATVATGLALDDAGELGAPQERVGVAIANVHGGAATLFEAHRALIERGADRVSPLVAPLSLANGAVAAAARTHGLRGPSAAPSTACAAGADAIGQALAMIREGRAEAIVAGGAEAPLSPVVVAAYRRAGALTRSQGPPDRASRPFDRGRDGFVIAEGAGVLLLEEREHALARDAHVYAELVGYGSTCDAAHLTDPDPTGAGPARAMTEALADAGLAPWQVGYLNAHATSTLAGDLAEARAVVLAGLAGTAISSTKSVHGHALGAAGGLEAAASLLPFARGVLPPTHNLEDPEPDPALDHVVAPRAAEVDAVLSNSFGFGGHNACLVFARHR